jgi:hypothetical protein
VCVEILHPHKARVQDDGKALSVSKLVRGGGREKQRLAVVKAESQNPHVQPRHMGHPTSSKRLSLGHPPHSNQLQKISNPMAI